MLRRTFNLNQPYRVVIYARMSSDKQNPRSPEQQKETILALIQRLKLPWTVVVVYTDSAISGRYFRKRTGLQDMLRAIRTKSITVDLVLVDTFERFGRADEAAALRKELHTHHGVLILTADSNFSDPTSVSGELLSTFEQVRAKDDGRVKAHNVLRGKRDAAKAKHWPGGKPPFGYRLESVMKMENGRQVLDYSILMPDEATGWIIRALYQRAADTAEGCLRLTRWYNANPDIPDAYKPVSEHTINRWLKSEIYKGTLVWERKSSDVLGDRRVIEHNSPDVHLVVTEFCEPLVPPDLWDAVNGVRSTRKTVRAATGGPIADDKLLAPLAGGVAIKNILSGLVVCGRCRLAMVPTASGPYTTKGTGEEKRYAAYKCPRARTGACENAVSVPIDWLNKAVVGLLRERLFTPQS